MASTASTLSWSSSTWLQSFVRNTNEATKSTERRVNFEVFAQKKAKKTRAIILKEDVDKVGTKGKLVNVKAGFFRNYLLPTGKAQIVTPTLLKPLRNAAIPHCPEWNYYTDWFYVRREMKIEEERIEAEKRRVKEEAQQLARMFEAVGSFKVKRKGGKGKQIFGSVTALDLVDIIKAQLQRDIDKRIVTLPEIREIGEYVAELKLHPEVTARVRLNVLAN